MGQSISKAVGVEEPEAEKNLMDPPDEILVIIMGYLSNKDVLKIFLKNVSQQMNIFVRIQLTKLLDFCALQHVYVVCTWQKAKVKF